MISSYHSFCLFIIAKSPKSFASFYLFVRALHTKWERGYAPRVSGQPGFVFVVILASIWPKPHLFWLSGTPEPCREQKALLRVLTKNHHARAFWAAEETTPKRSCMARSGGGGVVLVSTLNGASLQKWAASTRGSICSGKFVCSGGSVRPYSTERAHSGLGRLG